MSSLNKLAIRGIRSFDDKQVSVIEFFSPVTVTVGHNGSGKTTVIWRPAKAQVKLRFHAANGQRILLVRNLSVTAKKTGLTMKTLESILGLADSNAEKVGKEDSYWPLTEPFALKKKFDGIFEATRYTKALDSIKGLRKDRVADLKADKERLESLSKEKAHADKLRACIVDLSNSITSKQLQYEECKGEYERLVKSNAQFYEFREIYIKVENLQQKKERYQQELLEVHETVEEALSHSRVLLSTPPLPPLAAEVFLEEEMVDVACDKVW